MHDIKKATFYHWQKRYGSKESKTNKQKGFIPMKLTPSSIPPSGQAPSLFAEVNGIRLYHIVSADYLKALLS
jgi:hypothetical protein